MKTRTGARSRPVVSTALFLAAVLGQVWFWRKLLFGGSLSEQPPVLYAELAFLAVILLLAILTATPRGLGGKKRCGAALAGFTVYAVFNVVNIGKFAAFNMTASDSAYGSLGPALVALKLFLVLAGVIAAMPAAPAPEGREYADRLMTAAQRQSAQWVKEGAKGAQKDLKKTIDNLRGQLSPEELDALLKDLQKDPLSVGQAEEAPASAETVPAPPQA